MASEQPPGLATVETVRIFLSYSPRTEAETELSARLVDFFASAFDLPPKAVFAYTAAGHGVTSGVDLFDGLKSALAASQVVLAIATPAVASSSFSQFEAAASDLAGKYSVPLLPDPSFHPHVPAVFQKIAARNLASIGELCQLIEDMKVPLGVAVQPSYAWIINAERVVEAARAVAGKASPEAQVEHLQTKVAILASGVKRLRWATALGCATAIVLAIAMASLWQAHTTLTSRSTELEADLATANAEIERINRRSVYLPTLRIEGEVLTTSGAKAERAHVVACAALRYPASMLISGADACPEQLGLPAETDSEGRFGIDLRSLPDLPDDLAPPAPLQDFWLTAEHGSEGSVRLRVQPVNLQKNLQLRR